MNFTPYIFLSRNYFYSIYHNENWITLDKYYFYLDGADGLDSFYQGKLVQYIPPSYCWYYNINLVNFKYFLHVFPVTNQPLWSKEEK